MSKKLNFTEKNSTKICCFGVKGSLAKNIFKCKIQTKLPKFNNKNPLGPISAYNRTKTDGF